MREKTKRTFKLHSPQCQSLTPFLSHKYTLFISVDGNFRLQRKIKNNDPDDVALNKGNSIFVDDNLYRQYLDHVGQVADVDIASRFETVSISDD